MLELDVTCQSQTRFTFEVDDFPSRLERCNT